MDEDEWMAQVGNKVVDGAGATWKVIGYVTDPAVLLQDALGRRSTLVMSSLNAQEFKPDRRGDTDRRGSQPVVAPTDLSNMTASELNATIVAGATMADRRITGGVYSNPQPGDADYQG
jgi:hypothetical protein